VPGGTEALISLFGDQFIISKVEKIRAVLRVELGWLAGLINTGLSLNMGYSESVLVLISRSLIVCLRCDHYS
jgi:hypothetical protein